MTTSTSEANDSRAVYSVFLSLLSMQIGSALAKQIFETIGGRGATSMRTLGAALILCAIWRLFTKRVPHQARGALLGYGVAIATMNLAFYQAIETIPLGIAIALDFTGPLAIVLFRSRKVTDLLWGLVAAAGLFMLLPLVGQGSNLDVGGVLWALLSGASWMGYILFGQKVTLSMPAGPALAWAMMLATVITLPIGIAYAGASLLDPTVCWVSLGVAIFSSALPYSLELFAMARLRSTTFSTLMSLEPAIGATAGFIFLREQVSLFQGLGILAIVGATAGAARTRSSP